MQFPAKLITFTDEIFNGKFHILCSEICLQNIFGLLFLFQKFREMLLSSNMFYNRHSKVKCFFMLYCLFSLSSPQMGKWFYRHKQTLNSVKPAQESSSENLWKKNTTRLTNFYFHCVKCVHIQSFSAPYFPAFGLYFPHSINLYIQSKIGKIQTRKNLNTNTFQVSFFMHRRVYFHISITYFKQIYNFLYNGLEVKENINFMEMCEA